MSTYNCRVNKCSPAFLLLKQGENKRNSSRTKQDEDELILELLEDELPDGRWWLFGNG